MLQRAFADLGVVAVDYDRGFMRRAPASSMGSSTSSGTSKRFLLAEISAG
jgi:hypothetical protein